MRHTRSQTRQRRSHHALKSPALIACECGAQRLRHRACPSCGRYKGRVIVDHAAKAAAKSSRRQKRQTATAQK